MKRIWKVFSALHVFLYRLTGGRIGGRMGNNRILLLQTVGRKSRKARVNPLVYFQDGDDYIITASNNGEDRHPGWYFNLKHRPETTVQVLDARIPVTARQVEGDERSRLWAKLTADHPQFTGYQRKTTREIPMFALSAD